MANLSLRAHKEAPNTPFHQTLAHAHLIPCQLKENTDDYTNCTTTSIVAPKSRHSMWLKASAGLELCIVCECGNPCKPTLITRKTRLASQAKHTQTLSSQKHTRSSAERACRPDATQDDMHGGTLRICAPNTPLLHAETKNTQCKQAMVQHAHNLRKDT